MLDFLKFLTKRPSDTIILRGRIVFGLLLMSITVFNMLYLHKPLEASYINEDNMLGIKFGIILLGLIPIFMGLSNFCLLHKKYMRIVQVIFGILLFYISGLIPASANLDYDIIIFLMGFLPFISGITGKCITSKCLKYKEKITKIRV